MCQKVIINQNNKNVMIAFDSPNAKLPIVCRDGAQMFLTWGRKKKNNSSLPLGGTIFLDEIHSGKWDKFFPKPVKLPIRSFMVRDIEDNAKWFELPSDKWVQGMFVNDENDMRVYIVTLLPPDDSVYPRWPRVMIG